mgnify:CR=1 FL=1
MTCFKIAHHKNTDGLWSSNPNFKYKQRCAQDTRKKTEKRAYSLMTSHPIYIRLRRRYGLDLKKRKREGEREREEECSDDGEGSDNDGSDNDGSDIE